MKRIHGLLLAGLGAFVLTLIAQLPAAVAIGWLAPEGVRTSGVSGSIWHGHAREVTVHGLRLTETSWTLSILELLRARLGARVEARLGEGTLGGNAVFHASGGMHCTDCRFEGTVTTLRALMPTLNAMDGRLGIDLGQLEIEDGWPTRILGTAMLGEVTLPKLSLEATGKARPSFKIDISADPVPDTGLIEAMIVDAGGPVECSVRARLTPPGNYELKGRIRARSGAAEQLASAIAALGARAPDGSTEVSLSGSF